MTRKQTVAAAFGSAASTYDKNAQAQSRAADGVVDLVLARTLPRNPCVLEVGCGTGLLTRKLLPKVGGDWLVTDLSPAMVKAAEDNTCAINATFRVMDGEHPDVPTGLFDLVVSNLAAQWFCDLGRALNQLQACLSPGGVLVLSTLGRGSFKEWRAAHETLGLSCGMPVYPTAEELAALLPAGSRVLSEQVIIGHDDGYDFVESLKRIGAGTPNTGHVPLSPGALRKVLRAMGAPVAITYDILYAVVEAR
ncbi:MAG: methyltransferase domain-containing protein [Rhodospirillaceae bacterium]|nr:methyltransferase domain-containing protein [Rhodospirillales bacterium]